MNLSPEGLKLIQQFEGLRLRAYKDTGGVWTIGWGTIRYPGGEKVKEGDVVSASEADAYLLADVRTTVLAVDALTVDSVTQRQFDALVSFAYNVGTKAYQNSTLRKLVNANPNDPKIVPAFMRWVYDNGEKVQGLINRRRLEAEHYAG